MNELNPSERNRLSELLATYAMTVTADRITLGDIVHLLGNRSIPGIMLVLALPIALPIPAPGISAFFGFPLALVSAQLVFRRRHVWFPAKLASQSVSRAKFVNTIKHVLPVLRQLEHILKPRASWLCGQWAYVPIGIMCVILALIIALPVPFGHFVPSLAISLLALGLIEHDGWVIGLGLASSILAVIIIVAAALGIHSLTQMLGAL